MQCHISLVLACLIALLGQESDQTPVLRPGSKVEGEIKKTDLEVHTKTLDRDYTEAPVRGRSFRLEVENGSKPACTGEVIYVYYP